MGVLEPEHAAAAREARIGREKSELQAALARLMEDRADDDENAGASRFSLDLAESSHAT